MRYSDGPTVEVDVFVNAPPGRVWTLVIDINTPARFSAEFEGADWLEPDSGPATGARFRGRNRHAAVGGWETISTVVQCDEPHVFTWAVGDPDHPSATWTFELDAEGDGTRLRQRARLGPAPSGLTPAIEAMPDKEERIIARRLDEHRANMHATVEGIKALAEAAPA